MPLQSIKNIFSDQSRAHTPLANQITVAMAVEQANVVLQELFPGAVPEALKALWLRHGVLTIGCRAAPVAQEVALYKPRILELLRAKFGRPLITELKLAPLVDSPDILPNT